MFLAISLPVAAGRLFLRFLLAAFFLRSRLAWLFLPLLPVAPPAIALTATSLAVTATAGFARARFGWLGGFLRLVRVAGENRSDALEKSGSGRLDPGRCRRRLYYCCNRRYFGRLLVLDRLRDLRFIFAFGQREAGSGIFRKVDLVIANTADLVVRCFQRRVCDQDDLGTMSRLETLYPVSLLIEKIRCDFNRKLCNNF